MDTAHALAGKHVVVTGFTGFLAKVYVSLLLDRVPEIGRISLLVRPRGRIRPAVVRVERAIDTSPAFRPLRARYGAGLPEWLGARIDAIDADIEKPGCALTPEALARLGSADLVVHCAGMVEFEPDPLAALATNVAGAVNVADLADRLGAPMVHVSTCYVAGAIGTAVVAETLEPGVAPTGARFDPNAEIRALQLACRSVPVPSDRIAIGLERARALGWPNIYTYTKALAEHVLARRPSTRLTIVRPSIVECARSWPFPGWNEGLNTAGPLAWLISTAFRRLPTVPEHNFDVVPVDDVAKGLAAISGLAVQGRAGGVFQLATSDHNPLSFARAVELTGLGMRRWTRQGHGTEVDRALFRHLDPVPVPADQPGPFAFDRLRRWSDWLKAGAEVLDEVLPEPLREVVDTEGLRKRLDDRVRTADDTMGKIESMLTLYRPFIHDNDWVFRTDRARSATAADPLFRFDLADLDWCRYWVDVEYPGLRKWCIPLIDGDKVPDDPPGQPPFRLPRSEGSAEIRVASK
ncbi:MAG: SDR family oxidoreductase [Myxococcota bacterium]